MALVCFAEIKSRIKGHHVYDYKYLLKEELGCLKEPTNRFSSHAIVVKPKTRNDKRKQKQLLSESEKITLAKILYPPMTTWK